jgi:hypothetical protein
VGHQDLSLVTAGWPQSPHTHPEEEEEEKEEEEEEDEEEEEKEEETLLAPLHMPLNVNGWQTREGSNTEGEICAGKTQNGSAA